MTTTLVRFALLCLFLAAPLACSGGRGDPLASDRNATAYGGRLTLGQDRVNTPVSSSNKLRICQLLNGEIYGAYQSALKGLADTPQKEDSLGIVRVSGRYSGYMQVQGATTYQPDTTGQNFWVRMTFFDYSDSAAVFMGGQVDCSGYMDVIGLHRYSVKVVLNGGLAFAGGYSGEALYETQRLPIDPCNQIISPDAPAKVLHCYPELEQGSMTLISGDTRFNFKPYFKDVYVDPDSLDCGCQ
ncbi:hypothetical protein LLH00_12740 [bacterium]|nr:hypothetical protein [bacterium]